MKTTLLRRTALVAAAAVGTSVIATASALASSPTTPWQPEASSAGTLTFYNASGQVIRSGSINDAPFASYVQGSAPGLAGNTTATLYAYTPVAGHDPGSWSGEQLSTSSTYPNASAPAPLNSGSLPLVSLGSGDEKLATYIGHYPNNDASTTDGYSGIYELRLRTAGGPNGINSRWESADIQVTGSTWTQVYPAVLSNTVANVPATATYGKAFSIPVTVSSTVNVSGTVTATSGSTVLGTATLGADTTSSGVSSATATISVPGTKLAPGKRAITVTFSGNPGVQSSASSVGTVTIAQASSSTTAKLSAVRVSHRARAKITVTVSATGVVPSGTVAIYSGTRKIGAGTLRNGKVVITLPALRKGRYKLTARYLGSSTVKASTSRAVILTSV